MRGARRHGRNAARQPRHVRRNRSRRRRGGSVADLVVRAASPAQERVIGADGARVIRAQGYRRRAESQPRHVHRRRAVREAAVAELAGDVAAPALERAPRDNGASMVAAGGDGGRAARKSRHVDGRGAHGRRAVAQLPVGVAAPALHATGIRERAGKPIAGRNADHAARKPGDVGRHGAIGSGAIAHLAGPVRAPALERAAAGHDRAAVEGAHGNLLHPGGEPAAQDGRRLDDRAARIECREAVLAPAANHACGIEAAGTGGTRAGGHHGRQPVEREDGHRRQGQKERPEGQGAHCKSMAEHGGAQYEPVSRAPPEPSAGSGAPHARRSRRGGNR